MFAQLATEYGAPNPLDGTEEPKQELGFQNPSHFSTLLASTNTAPLSSSSFGTLSFGGQTLTPTSSNLGNSDPFLSSSTPVTFPPLSGQLPTNVAPVTLPPLSGQLPTNNRRTVSVSGSTLLNSCREQIKSRSKQ
mmetsp:Transcript_8544/g.12186  ORF Transcript_8544/g.12186 Transcript_8544/m.12186 type:complete len:135 (+) Transcript_8544:382-786(+)